MSTVTHDINIELSSRMSVEDIHFEQGKFSYHRGEYRRALELFTKSATQYREGQNFDRYIECCNYILRILAEREDFTHIDVIETELRKFLESEAVDQKLKSRSYYILGICHCYRGQKYDLAMQCFRQAIDDAVEANDKAALASPLYGTANVLYAKGKYEEALKELASLDVLLSCLHLHEIKSASLLLRALIKRNQKNVEEALEYAWAAYESLKSNPHFVLYLQTLVALGSIYLLKNDERSAAIYLELAIRSVNSDELPRLARLTKDTIDGLKTHRREDYDLIFDSKTGVLLGKRGEIRFEGQFVLRDLLRAFLEEPGRVFSKEDLVMKVWNEVYDPANHDNKIYVTIKRLRQLLEGPGEKTQFILRAKNGYFLNAKTKVLIV